MNRQFPFISLFLLVLIPNLLLSQDRAIRPVNLQIPNGEQIELYKGSYALVIGVSDYQDNAWANLSSVPQDVDAVAEALQGHGFEVTQVLNPTESDLIAAMDDFIDNHGYDKDNRLLIYYSGHGHTIERNGRKFGYLVPIDAPSPIDNEKDFFRRAIKMERILSWAKQIESKHALFLFDSCFSGSVLESRAITIPEDISYSTSKPVRQFISAGSANQTVPAVSVFRPTFIRGINGDADLDKDGYVTGVELGMYLQKRVPYYQSGQTPQYGKIRDPHLDEGNFVFEIGNGRKSASKSVTLYISESDLFKNFTSYPASWKKSRTLDSDTVYVGEVINDVPNGMGSITTPTDEKYTGLFVNGKIHGQGTWITSNGFKYVGEFKNGLRNGKGVLSIPNGEKYEGEFKNGKFEGQGSYTFSKGEKYEGEFKNGKFEGQGTFTIPSVLKYVGKFVDNKFSGQGTLTESSGAKYVGTFKNGNRHGRGIWTHPDRRKYVGEWRDDKKNGQGTFTFPEGRVLSGLWENDRLVDENHMQQNQSESNKVTLYISEENLIKDLTSYPSSWKTRRNSESDFIYFGEASKGLPNGQGKFTAPTGEEYISIFANGSLNGQGSWTNPNGEKYVGEFKNYVRSGKGTYTWSKGKRAGQKYVGEFKNDKRDGKGTYTFPDGEKYVGEFKNDKRDGKGTYTFPDGEKYVGEFKFDKKNGRGIWTNSSGEKYEGEYKNDEKNGQGVYSWSKGKLAGQKYVGGFKDGRRHGQGTYSFPDGRKTSGFWKKDEFLGEKPIQNENAGRRVETLYISIDDLIKGLISEPTSWRKNRNSDTDTTYTGEVSNGIPNGQGTWSLDGSEYVGSFKDGKMHGQGTTSFPFGEKYVGSFKDGKMHGQGTWTHPDGQSYVGEWKDDRFNGEGTYNFSNGHKYVGSFSDGKKQGQGTFTFEDGRVKSGLWWDDKFVGSE